MSRLVLVRELDNDEEARLLQIVRRGGSGPVVTCRRAQMVLFPSPCLGLGSIAQVAFTSPDRIRDVLHNFNTDGFDSLHPYYAGGRPQKFSSGQREKNKKIALDRPADIDLPFFTWSLSKLAGYLVDKGGHGGYFP